MKAEAETGFIATSQGIPGATKAGEGKEEFYPRVLEGSVFPLTPCF